MKQLRVIVAPDSFKGSLSAIDVCSAIHEGVKNVFPDAEVVNLPLGDGGEGTLEICMSILEGRLLKTDVESPIGEKVNASYLLTGNGVAIIESAEACGLNLVKDKVRSILNAQTTGVGELIVKAVSENVKKIIVFLGGSATNDGGLGMLHVLGYRFYDTDSNELTPIPENLNKINFISDSEVSPTLKEIEFTVCADVENPLLGENGCARVFAPQKGASEGQVEILEKGMENFAAKVKDFIGTDFSIHSGCGAAGGLGFAFKSFLGAEIKSGIDFILDMTAFDSMLDDCTLVITGEGKVDNQSLMGKVLSGLLKRCLKKNVPLVALGGRVDTLYDLNKAGVTAVFPVSGPGESLSALMEKNVAYRHIRETTIQIMRFLMLTFQKKR